MRIRLARAREKKSQKKMKNIVPYTQARFSKKCGEIWAAVLHQDRGEAVTALNQAEGGEAVILDGLGFRKGLPR